MSWDDGKHAKVNKIQLTFDDVIRSIEVEYEGANLKSQRRGTVGSKSNRFALSTDEYITHVSGYYKTTLSGDLITALTFKTNKKTYGPRGKKTENYFSADAPRDSQIAGFLGTSGSALSSIDVHFAPIPTPGSIKPKPGGSGTGSGNTDTGSKPDSSTEKLDAQGGEGGNQWDDGGDYDGVTKIHVTVGRVIEQIRFDYVKNGQTTEGLVHGVEGAKSSINSFEISHPNEYLLTVKGWSDASNKIIGIQFITNTKISDYYGFEKYPGEEGTDISLEVKDKKIVGFHGFADTQLNSLGAYFAPIASTPLKPSKKLKAVGGDEGALWDDGAFDGVKKIHVGQNVDGVSFVAVEYENGSQKILGDGHGKKSALGVETFSVDYPNDNITAVGGTFKNVFTYDTTLITSLYFTTSKGITSPLFGEKKKNATDFEFKGENGGKLIGLHGRGGNAIDAIGAYFDTTGSKGSKVDEGSKTDVSGKKGPFGGEKGNVFDDVGFEGVKKIIVGSDDLSITYIKIEYIKDGKVVVREHGTVRGELKEFSVDYPNDNITAVGGTYKNVFTYDTTLITSLYFTTSKGITSPLFGEKKKNATDFEFKGENGGKLIGLHGRGGNAIDAIGAYFDTGSHGSKAGDGSKTDVAGKKGPLGGEKGEEFNDVGFEGVKKITVGADDLSITYIKIEYIKDGKVVVREHGTVRGEQKEFSVDYPNDSITEVGGSYKNVFTYDTTLITSLYFTTSKGITSPLFGEKKKNAKDFEFKDENGGQLIGFHGRGGNAIDAIGAYFDTGSKHGGRDDSGSGSNSGSSTQKLDAQGGKGGDPWDDGSDHDGVTKIYVTVGRGIEQVRFDYVKNGQTKEGPAHGVEGARSFIETFEISHPNEYLLTVKGWSDSTNKIDGIQFTTNTKTSQYYGSQKSPGDEGTDISLEVKDKKIVGFHGYAYPHLNSLGAYFAALKPSKKLIAVGGDEGSSWDDGAFDGVKKIHVGQNVDGVSFVAVEYENGSQKVLGDGHGKKSALGVETFELKYQDEYIKSVGVYYDKIYVDGRGVTLVTCLIFKTENQESQFGIAGGEYVELKEEDNKIVGFHGKASDWVHQIGVYVAPVTK